MIAAVAVAAPATLASDDVLPDVDRHVRVFAGPGAGKTHWLALHVRQVLRRSDRLGPGAKVACISYTNVAVAQLLARIGDGAHRVEGATIHAFLYRNLVRPYLHLLADDAGAPLVRHELVDGHDEHRPNYATVKEWHDAIGKPFTADQGATYEYLKTLHWVRDASGTWSLKPLTPRAPVRYLPTTRLDAYKPVYWKRGIVDHDDVLYFAYLLLEERPDLRAFLAARFPYVFVDEFQDTNPVQTQVVRWLAEAGSTVGVIGDAEQSIYGFQGARPEEFRAFALPGMDDYAIAGNRRSTDAIVALLNVARSDGLAQRGLRGEAGTAPVLFVGDAAEAFRDLRAQLGPGADLVALAYRNDAVRRVRNPAVAAADPWRELADADPARALFLERLLRAGELAFQGAYGPAVREALSAFRLRAGAFTDPVRAAGPVSEFDRRGLAVATLEWLAANRDSLRAGTLLDAYGKLGGALGVALPGTALKGASRGKFKAFAETAGYVALADSVRSGDEPRDVRTVHQAKGEEFVHVLVCLPDEKALLAFLSAGAAGTDAEQRRVWYVAASRARDGLYFTVPALGLANHRAVTGAGITVPGGKGEPAAQGTLGLD